MVIYFKYYLLYFHTRHHMRGGRLRLILTGLLTHGNAYHVIHTMAHMGHIGGNGIIGWNNYKNEQLSSSENIYFGTSKGNWASNNSKWNIWGSYYLCLTRNWRINSLKKVTIISSIITTTTTAFKYTNINKQIHIININTSQNSVISNMEVNKGVIFM